MNKHEALHALQKFYGKFFQCSGPTGAEFEEYKTLINGVAKFINDIPEDKEEEVTDGDSNPT